MLKWDGHTHTRFCYHGSDAASELYIDRAIELGFERYTLSEHPPLPANYVDDASLFAELAMPMEQLPDYFQYVKEMKEKYEGAIEITAGLELDYLQGHTDFTASIVDRWQHELQDVVYSVHYLPGVGGMRCIDFTPDDFKTNLLAYYGTMEKVVDEYYDHVEQAIAEASKLPMRTRIGHINLIQKFQTVLPPLDEEQLNKRMRALLPLLAGSKVAVDINTAGLRVATCGNAYVPLWFMQECISLGIACVYGSDAHKPEQVGFGYDYYEQHYLKR